LELFPEDVAIDQEATGEDEKRDAVDEDYEQIAPCGI
jgi:hypothetical protein